MRMRSHPSGSILLVASLLSVGCVARKNDFVNAKTKLFQGEMDLQNQFPAVYGIATKEPSSSVYAFADCTGTAISSSVLLTAAHCVYDETKVNVLEIFWIVDAFSKPVYDAKKTLITGTATAHPNFKVPVPASYPYDIAAINFPQGTFKNFAMVSTVPARVGDEVTLVGYGYNGGPVVGREFGKSKIFDVINDKSTVPKESAFPEDLFRDWYSTMYWLKVKKNSVGISGTVPGDSGGPLFLNNQLVGILRGGSAVYKSDDNGIVNDSIYANILNPSNLVFLDELRKSGMDIPSISPAALESVPAVDAPSVDAPSVDAPSLDE